MQTELSMRARQQNDKHFKHPTPQSTHGKGKHHTDSTTTTTTGTTKTATTTTLHIFL